MNILEIIGLVAIVYSVLAFVIVWLNETGDAIDRAKAAAQWPIRLLRYVR